MPKTVISYSFTNDQPYQADYGGELTYNGTFILPNDMDNAAAASLVTAADAQLTKINGEPVGDAVINPCPDTSGVKPRKLVFIRDNGASISLPVDSGNRLFEAAIAMQNALTAGGFNVVCVKLVGESFINLNDEFNLDVSGQNATGEPPEGGVGSYYSGVIQYSVDAPSGTTVLLPVKVRTNSPTAPPPIFSSMWDTCVGGFVNVAACGGTGTRRKHRRFTVDYFTADNKTERRELPVAALGDVQTCGQNIAQQTGVFCIGYEGESYDRLHKILPAPV